MKFKNLIELIARIAIYTWLSFWMILRSDTLFILVYEHAYLYGVFIFAISLFMNWKKYDVEMLKVLCSKKYVSILYILFILLWVHFGIEWYCSIGDKNNYESFMRYEPVAVVMGLPFSVVIFFANQFFSVLNIQDVHINAVILWSFYFIFSMIQVVFFARLIRKKMKNGVREQ